MNASDYQAQYGSDRPKPKRRFKMKLSPIEPTKASRSDLIAESINPLNAVWLKPGEFENVEDHGTHLEAYHQRSGCWYSVVVTKIDR